MDYTIAKAPNYCGVDLECKIISSLAVDADDNTEYTTYGVIVVDSLGNILYECGNISTDRSFVESFAAICETHFVHILHIDGILEDYLA